MTQLDEGFWKWFDHGDGAMPSLRSGRSATPSGPSPFRSWAKLAAAIAVTLIIFGLFFVIPAIFGGA